MRLLRFSAMLLYLLLIGYGSLYPFSGWRAPLDGSLAFLHAPWPRHITRTDLITNILAYMPLGYLLVAWLRLYLSRWRAATWAILAAALFSLLMECSQTLLPGRIAATLDIAANTAGAVLGVLLYRLLQGSKWPGRLLPGWRGRWLAPGLWSNFGLLVLALWGLSQLSLDAPSLVAGNLKTHFVPFWELPGDGYRFRPLQVLIFGLEGALASLLIASLMRRPPDKFADWARIFSFVLACKLLAAALLLKGWVLPRLLSAEMVSGTVLAVLLIIWARRKPAGLPTQLLALLLTLAGALQFLLHSSAIRIFSASSGAVPLNITALAAWVALVWPLWVLVLLWVRPVAITHRGP
jgi:VanZ family protein